MHYVFELKNTRTIKSSIVFEQSGYFGKIVFKGTFEQCCEFLKQ